MGDSAIIAAMILITGGTGFIGSRVIMRLVQANLPFKVLLRPKKETTTLPHNMPLDVAVSGLNDRRSLRAVLSKVSTILHFASAENEQSHPNYEAVEVEGTETLLKAASDAGVNRILYLSRIGADVNSVYPLLRAKALAEKTIMTANINYAILRLTDVFGVGDHFTNDLVRYVRSAPGVVPLPEKGEMMLQPLWVEDLISSIFILLNRERFEDNTFSIGGGEFINFHSITKMIMHAIRKKRLLVPATPAFLRLYNLWFNQSKGGFPLSNKWLDLLAVNRTCALDSLPRSFDLLPGRFSHHLGHL